MDSASSATPGLLWIRFYPPAAQQRAELHAHFLVSFELEQSGESILGLYKRGLKPRQPKNFPTRLWLAGVGVVSFRAVFADLCFRE